MTLAAGEYTLRWFDPRNGGELQTGSRPTVTAGEMRMRDHGTVQLSPPSEPGKDWVALLVKATPDR